MNGMFRSWDSILAGCVSDVVCVVVWIVEWVGYTIAVLGEGD